MKTWTQCIPNKTQTKNKILKKLKYLELNIRGKEIIKKSEKMGRQKECK